MMCGNGHRFGYCAENKAFVDEKCPVLVFKEGKEYPWTESTWKNNFEAIGGPKLAAVLDYDCPICNVSITNRKELVNHLQSKKHKSEERYFLEN